MNKVHVSLILAVAVAFLMMAAPQTVADQRTSTSEPSWHDVVLAAGNVLRESFSMYHVSLDCKEQRDNLTLLSAYDVLRRRHGVLDSVVESQEALIAYLFSACPVQSVRPYQTGDSSSGALQGQTGFGEARNADQPTGKKPRLFESGGGGSHELRPPFLEAYLIMTPKQRDIVWGSLAPEEQYFYHTLISQNYEEVLALIDQYGVQVGQDLTLDESMALPPSAVDYGLDLDTLVPQYASPVLVDPSGVYESIYDTLEVGRIVVDNEVLTSFTLNPLALDSLQPGSIMSPQDSTVTFSLMRTVTTGVGE